MHSGIYDKKGFFVRCIYLLIALSTYILTLGGRFAGKKSIILCYHGVFPSQRERFSWQVKTISNRKPQNIGLTFDDAFANLLHNAVPILEKYSVQCTIFAVFGNLGQNPCWKMPKGHLESDEKTMTAEQLIFLSKHRLIRVGSHTLTHPDLVEITEEEAKQELVQSRRNLETLLSCTVEDLALPHGSYNDAVLVIAKKAGYKRIYTLQASQVSDVLLEGVIGRFSMSPDVWKIEFFLTCAGAYSYLAGWRLFVSTARHWIQPFNKS